MKNSTVQPSVLIHKQEEESTSYITTMNEKVPVTASNSLETNATNFVKTVEGILPALGQAEKQLTVTGTTGDQVLTTSTSSISEQTTDSWTKNIKRDILSSMPEHLESFPPTIFGGQKEFVADDIIQEEIIMPTSFQTQFHGVSTQKELPHSVAVEANQFEQNTCPPQPNKDTRIAQLCYGELNDTNQSGRNIAANIDQSQGNDSTDDAMTVTESTVYSSINDAKLFEIAATARYVQVFLSFRFS